MHASANLWRSVIVVHLPSSGGGTKLGVACGLRKVKNPACRETCAALFKITPKGQNRITMRITRLTRSDGTVICARCALAVRPWSRMRGLLGRSSLAPDEGMLFRPASSIHMFFMRFPIDAVFCDRDLVVVGIERDLQPWKAARRKGAKVVIEIE